MHDSEGETGFVFLVLTQIAELLFLSGVVGFVVAVDALLLKRYPPPQLHDRYPLQVDDLVVVA